ncbi:TPA: hypothetical protein I9Y23_002190 [Kluyvera ascorbata]|uniref:Uncharacterized protein n=1 Tax=Kluyvera genomosp. 2 TaxID=2774054 RepID=A0A2T2Y372_9ENTR|nr:MULTISPECIES: hypothetical protein [Enterobacteriaceae]HAT3918556.1 hypothetical protein [Kluyvera ascorbata]PSR46979.1 hypothetical protein C8256_10410 [Kluyvera genomosp. 2]BBQ84288.1 hypothetical protein WP3W18E02_28170 [Klebsiella sp. WP3-W18-ESBL-02]BBR21293.1 hypothetical protein WP3S18E05_27730 [Klebsiella sp. WP3-S18-ESBL-05]HAT3943469.1 hypothetical protein [Kluyvera ascorbata]
MINEVAINVKIDSILEADNRLFLKPNSLGLYNVSEMLDRFALARADLAKKNNDPFATTTYKAVLQATQLFVSNLPQSESLVTINGAYWCDLDHLKLILKFCSPLYADAANMLESKEDITLSEWSDCHAKKYSVICFFGDSDECYISGAIWGASRILHNEKDLYEYVICTEIKVDETAKKYHLSQEAKFTLYQNTWRYCAHGIELYMQYYAQQQIHSYPKLTEIMKECFVAVEKNALELAVPPTPAVVTPKKGFWSRLF